MGNTVRAIMPGDIFTTSMTTRLLFLALLCSSLIEQLIFYYVRDPNMAFTAACYIEN
jgi:hypothetical protein